MNLLTELNGFTLNLFLVLWLLPSMLCFSIIWRGLMYERSKGLISKGDTLHLLFVLVPPFNWYVASLLVLKKL